MPTPPSAPIPAPVVEAPVVEAPVVDAPAIEAPAVATPNAPQSFVETLDAYTQLPNAPLADSGTEVKEPPVKPWFETPIVTNLPDPETSLPVETSLADTPAIDLDPPPGVEAPPVEKPWFQTFGERVAVETHDVGQPVADEIHDVEAPEAEALPAETPWTQAFGEPAPVEIHDDEEPAVEEPAVEAPPTEPPWTQAFGEPAAVEPHDDEAPAAEAPPTETPWTQAFGEPAPVEVHDDEAPAAEAPPAETSWAHTFDGPAAVEVHDVEPTEPTADTPAEHAPDDGVPAPFDDAPTASEPFPADEFVFGAHRAKQAPPVDPEPVAAPPAAPLPVEALVPEPLPYYTEPAHETWSEAPAASLPSYGSAPVDEPWTQTPAAALSPYATASGHETWTESPAAASVAGDTLLETQVVDLPPVALAPAEPPERFSGTAPMPPGMRAPGATSPAPTPESFRDSRVSFKRRHPIRRLLIFVLVLGLAGGGGYWWTHKDDAGSWSATTTAYLHGEGQPSTPSGTHYRVRFPGKPATNVAPRATIGAGGAIVTVIEHLSTATTPDFRMSVRELDYAHAIPPSEARSALGRVARRLDGNDLAGLATYTYANVGGYSTLRSLVHVKSGDVDRRALYVLSGSYVFVVTVDAHRGDKQFFDAVVKTFHAA